MALSTTKNKQPLIIILQQLMKESSIKEAELARQTGLPQTTINRLLLGGTTDPRAHTLKPIADFFGVTIGQLCGFEPLSPYRIIGTTQTTHRASWQSIPIIEWQQVKSWLFQKKNITPLTHPRWIMTERPVSDRSFALNSLSFMEPRFRKGSILIIDPQAQYNDGHFIVVALDGVTPTVRKVLKDGQHFLLRTFDHTQKAIPLDKKHIVYGTIVESRMDTYND